MNTLELRELDVQEMKSVNGGICDMKVVIGGLKVTAAGVATGNPLFAALGIGAMWYGASSC